MLEIDTVTSRTNPTVRLVRSLYERRSARTRAGLFVAEGLRTLQTLVAHGCLMTHLLVDAGRLDETPLDLIEAAQAADARLLAVESAIFTQISDVESAQPVIGVFKIPNHPPPQAPTAVVVLDGIQDPGNLGSILRTCRAARVDAVLLMKGSADPYSPKVVRATAGQFTALPLLRLPSVEALKTSDFTGFPAQILIADSAGGQPHTAIDWSSPFVLVLGNEAAGPSRAWDAYAAGRVRIAIAPEVESLNVAAAAAVLLFEARRDCVFE